VKSTCRTEKTECFFESDACGQDETQCIIGRGDLWRSKEYAEETQSIKGRREAEQWGC
jgi:hypothetical protein